MVEKIEELLRPSFVSNFIAILTVTLTVTLIGGIFIKSFVALVNPELSVYLWFLPLIYLGLYIFFTFLKSINEKLDEIIFCSVCASFFTALIIGIFLKFNILILALMLGMTLTGISHELVDYLEMKNKRFIMRDFLIQLLLFLAGFGMLILIGGK